MLVLWETIRSNRIKSLRSKFSVIDSSYCGDNDQWHMPVFCLMPKGTQEVTIKKVVDGKEVEETITHIQGSHIRKGDKICQFRIVENMPEFEFEEVSSLGNSDRGGFGSTGPRQ